MFRCQHCGQVSKLGESARKVVIEDRPRQYRNEWGYVIGEGWEIVKELMVCERCEKERSYNVLNYSERSYYV